MTDKYKLVDMDKYYAIYERSQSDYCEYDMPIAKIYCSQDIAHLLDKCLNQTSRAGQAKSQAKRDAAKRNIAKRWKK